MSKTVKNAEYNVDGSIDCEVWSDELQEWLPFTATPDDPEQHGVDLYNDLKNGVYGTVAPVSQEAKDEALEDAKDEKRVEIDEAYQSALAAGVNYNGNTFPLTERMQQNITAVASAINAGITRTKTPYWPVIDGAPVQLTDSEVTSLASAAIDKVTELSNKNLGLLGDIDDATDQDDLDKISWND